MKSTPDLPPAESVRADALSSVDHLFRRKAGQMVSTLTRIFGVAHLDLVEDVVQDALLKALRQWPYHGVPENPSAWIIQVAKNRALDLLRRQDIWSAKETQLKKAWTAEIPEDPDLDRRVQDDQLQMIFVCCHPVLSRDAQVALTLKTVGGFSVTEIARAFLAKTATIAQRLVRAKQRLREAGIRFDLPPEENLADRLNPVLEAVYLMFNEGYDATEGDQLVRTELCAEAVRLAQLVTGHPAVGSPKADALAALLLYQRARLRTRVDADGNLVLLRDQDRSLWNRDLIRQATLLLGRAGRGTGLSSYHLEAEIAACHALSPSYATTDWERILGCYDALLEINPSPVVAVNRLVPLLKVRGAEPALAESDRLLTEAALKMYCPALVIRGGILQTLGRIKEAEECFENALLLTQSEPVRRSIVRRSNSPLDI